MKPTRCMRQPVPLTIVYGAQERDRCNARANVDRNRVSEDVYGSW